MRWTQKEPTYGDIIRVPFKFYHHYGIFIDSENVVQFGLRDNSVVPVGEIKVIVTDIDTFCDGELIETGECETSEEKHDHRKPKDIVEAALARVGEDGYHILHNNCEHFVYSCAFGKKKCFLDDIREKIRNKLQETE